MKNPYLAEAKKLIQKLKQRDVNNKEKLRKKIEQKAKAANSLFVVTDIEVETNYTPKSGKPNFVAAAKAKMRAVKKYNKQEHSNVVNGIKNHNAPNPTQQVLFKTKYRKTKKQKELEQTAIFIKELKDCLEGFERGYFRAYTYITLPPHIMKKALKAQRPHSVSEKFLESLVIKE